MKTIKLENLNLQFFTKEDFISMCHLQSFNPEQLFELILINLRLNNLDFLLDFNFNKLEKLDTHYNPKIKNLNYLQNMSNLKYLNIRNNEIEDISLIFKHLINLNTLNISDNKITDINDIKNLKDLKYLDLSWNGNLKDIRIIKYLRNLETLDIRFMKIDYEDEITDILLNMKKLKTLYYKKTFKRKYEIELNKIY